MRGIKGGARLDTIYQVRVLAKRYSRLQPPRPTHPTLSLPEGASSLHYPAAWYATIARFYDFYSTRRKGKSAGLPLIGSRPLLPPREGCLLHPPHQELDRLFSFPKNWPN